MDERGIPDYQLRELTKQLTLLEGHLRDFRPQAGEQICCHCSQKHAFNIEALAEESLNILPELAPHLRRLSDWARKNQEFFRVCEMQPEDADRLLQECREFRKPIMEAMDHHAHISSDVRTSAPEDAILHAHGYNPGLLDGEDELLIHAIPDAIGMGAIVLDREKAMAHPCLRIRGDGAELVFAKGAVGALTAEEQKELCVKGYIEPSAASQEHFEARLETFKAASRECRDAVRALMDPRQRVVAYVECMRARLAGREYLPRTTLGEWQKSLVAAGETGHPIVAGIPETGEPPKPRRARRVTQVVPEAELTQAEQLTQARMVRNAKILERRTTQLGSKLAIVQVEGARVRVRTRGTKDQATANEWGQPYPEEYTNDQGIRSKAVEKFLAGKDIVAVGE